MFERGTLDWVYGTIAAGQRSYSTLMSRIFSLCAVGILMAAFPAVTGSSIIARIQDGSADVCWSPDNEWPVPCDEE